MTTTKIDPATGNLLVAGKPVFPLGLSDPPPVDGTAPDGSPAWAEISKAGINFARDFTVWSEAALAEQLLEADRRLGAAQKNGLQMWLALAGVDNNLGRERLLTQIVQTFKDHPGLGVWKGADEPMHGHIPATSLAAVRTRLRELDPNHPLAIIEAPRNASPAPGTPDKPLTAAALRPYAAACDIHGVDIYPVSIPPGRHAGGPPVKTDIGVVGDVTKIVAAATRRKAIWTTLQIAWSGVLPPHPVVFPNLQQARFMAYDAVIAGARGLFFFGGHLTAVLTPQDKQRGWNWTYWEKVQKPLVEELAAPNHVAALVAPDAPFQVTADASDVLLSARQTDDAIFVLAVRRSETGSVRVGFHGLPGTVKSGSALAHGPSNPARPIRVQGGSFSDSSPYGAHHARVYRFPLRP